MADEDVRKNFETDTDTCDPVALDIEVARIAKLPRAEYLLRHRKQVAKEFNVPVGQLDVLVRDAIRAAATARRQHAAAPQAETAKTESAKTESPPTAVDVETAAGAVLYETAKELFESDDVMQLVDEQLKGEGYAGDTSPACRTYLAISSRFLDRPLNVHRLALASSGKNFSIDAVLPMFPGSAYLKFTASSERALIYNSESFEHRTIIVDEMDSLPTEGPAAAAVRSIVIDAQMTYDTVERDPETNEYCVRHIVKRGPTGLITTGTRSLDPQMSTRVLIDTLPDTPVQTRLVMQAQARAANYESDPNFAARKKFVAFQEWLALKGERRSVMPFAGALACLIPAEQVRMRRDFPQILTAIKTVAFLHQVKRERDEKGRVVATFGDYAVARELLADVFDVLATDGISDAVRAAVEALNETGEEVSLAVLADRLKVSRTVASYRSRRAIYAGYLVNLETKKGHPARLQRALPLPDKESALPTVEKLKAEFEKPQADLDRLAQEDAEIDRLAAMDADVGRVPVSVQRELLS